MTWPPKTTIRVVNALAVAGDSPKNTEVRRGLQPFVDLATNIGPDNGGFEYHLAQVERRSPKPCVHI